MELVLKHLLSAVIPIFARYALSHREILIKYMEEESKKTTNELDDHVVNIVAGWLRTL